jgi:ABC-type sugar transport system ATPase subunit
MAIDERKELGMRTLLEMKNISIEFPGVKALNKLEG